MPAECAIAIRGGVVVDGTGAPGARADVAIVDDRITALGDLADVRADLTIDASDKVVAPGFIDAHTHDDRALLSTRDMAPKVSQGVTTVIAGNCGISLSPWFWKTGRRRRWTCWASPNGTASRPSPLIGTRSTRHRRPSTRRSWWAIRPCAWAPWTT